MGIDFVLICDTVWTSFIHTQLALVHFHITITCTSLHKLSDLNEALYSQ